MKLNDKNALSAGLLTADDNELVAEVPILHFGVGGFHRAHQAWALQTLKNKKLGVFDNWFICGVCILETDLPFVEAFRNQDELYYVQKFAPNGKREKVLVSAIRELLHPVMDYATILTRVADEQTKVISFTITEGGYNVDYNEHAFIWESAAVQNDLKRQGTPQTVFRILAEGLRKRMEAEGSGLVLMSCDNIQHNGDILKFALMEFLGVFDEKLIPWVNKNVSFVKTMVDRITPVTSREQKDDFTATHDIDDNCLVVCEDFFQWIIENDPRLEGLPYSQMGAHLVKDVAPYEKMKLHLLNGGHSLIGLLGNMLGYDKIHSSIMDPLISQVYRRYCNEEVMESLDIIQGVSYGEYMDTLISRFSNPMINDSTGRIISGSTDKLPKFVLPVILCQLLSENGQVKWGTLILAAWYFYLEEAYRSNRMANVIDLNRGELMAFFDTNGLGPAQFLNKITAMAEVKDQEEVTSLFLYYVKSLSSLNLGQRRVFIEKLLETKTNV